MVSDCDPMVYILTRQILGGKYSKWIIILQEFYLEFVKSKSKKALVFVEFICDFTYFETKTMGEDYLPNESLFIISTLDPWYGNIIIYIQTQNFGPELSRTDHHCIRYQS